MCGVVDGGIRPGLWGYKAGQSGVGDIFGWFVEHGVPPSTARGRPQRGTLHEQLTSWRPSSGRRARAGRARLAQRQPLVLVDHELSGLIVGLTLATRPRTSTARWWRPPRSGPG